jgi:hypothetical protein
MEEPKTLKSQLQYANELILEMFIQACTDNDGMLNHFFISTYEEAQQYLLKLKRIKKTQCKYK